ncbi:MAG: MFS transporter, partial [Candidatus Dormibacteraceae bacterium]
MKVFKQTFKSLRIRNYRLYFFGQVVSLTGTWMQTVAQMWLVLRLTHSGVALGLTTAFQFLPVLLLGAFGGVIADRFKKRRLLFLTQTLNCLLAAGLAYLTLSGRASVALVYLFAFGLGLVNVFDNPTRQSFVAEMVGAKLMPNAVALNSTIVTSSRMIGPAVAGVVIETTGLGWCFILNALSFAGVLAALLLMRPKEFYLWPSEKSKWQGQLKEGLTYAWQHPVLRLPLLLMLAVGLLGFNFNVLVPLLATQVFAASPSTYGLLFSVLGIGSLLGALYVAHRPRSSHLFLIVTGMAFGILMMLGALALSLWLEMLLLLLIGAATTIYQTVSNSVLQMNSEPRLRGRVMALYLVVFMGTTPVGGPIVGWLAQTLGVREEMLIT